MEMVLNTQAICFIETVMDGSLYALNLKKSGIRGAGFTNRTKRNRNPE
jgi:hypothetical protein